jgi:hypothetical protein
VTVGVARPVAQARPRLIAVSMIRRAAVHETPLATVIRQPGPDVEMATGLVRCCRPDVLRRRQGGRTGATKPLSLALDLDVDDALGQCSATTPEGAATGQRQCFGRCLICSVAGGTLLGKRGRGAAEAVADD